MHPQQLSRTQTKLTEDVVVVVVGDKQYEDDTLIGK